MPEVVYKFTSSHFAPKLITGEVVWVGTSRGFQDKDKHGDKRGDDTEGALLFKHDKRWNDSAPEAAGLRAAAAEMGVLMRGNSYGNSVKADVVLNRKNYRIYSTFLSMSPDAGQKLGADVDCCVAIQNADKFFARLDEAVRAQEGLPPGRWGPVTYADVIRSPFSPHVSEDLLRKSPDEYGEQDEFRYFAECASRAQPRGFKVDMTDIPAEICWRK